MTSYTTIYYVPSIMSRILVITDGSALNEVYCYFNKQYYYEKDFDKLIKLKVFW